MLAQACSGSMTLGSAISLAIEVGPDAGLGRGRGERDGCPARGSARSSGAGSGLTTAATRPRTLMNALYLAGRWDRDPGATSRSTCGPSRPMSAGHHVPVRSRRLPARRDGVSPTGVTSIRARGAGRLRCRRARLRSASVEASPGNGRQRLRRLRRPGARSPRGSSRPGHGTSPRSPLSEILALIDALVGMEDWDALRRFLPEARDVAAQLALASPAIDRAEGLASAAAGDVPRAVELLRRAVDGFDPLSPFEAARTREALAAVDPEGRDELLSAAPRHLRAAGRGAARCWRAFGHCCLGSHWPELFVRCRHADD